MTAIFLDGWDHYDTPRIPQKWTSVNHCLVNNPGRFSYGGSIVVNGGTGGLATRGMGSAFQQWIVGFAFYTNKSVLIQSQLILINDSVNGSPGGDQLLLFITPAGNIQLKGGNGSTIATSSPNVINAQNWHYVELKVKIASAVGGGSYAIRLDGEPVPGLPDASGVQTSFDGNAFADTLTLGNTADGNDSTIQMDDLYVLNWASAPNNDFLGPIRIQALFPTSDGALEQWTMSPDQGAGNHWKNVNQNPPDDDTTYNFDATVGQRDSFHFGAMVGTPTTVPVVQLVAYARKGDAVTRQIANFVRISATNYDGVTNTISDTYRFYGDLFDQNPATSVPWSVADVNGIEAGYKEVT